MKLYCGGPKLLNWSAVETMFVAVKKKPRYLFRDLYRMMARLILFPSECWFIVFQCKWDTGVVICDH